MVLLQGLVTSRHAADFFHHPVIPASVQLLGSIGSDQLCTSVLSCLLGNTVMLVDRWKTCTTLRKLQLHGSSNGTGLIPSTTFAQRGSPVMMPHTVDISFILVYPTLTL